jgi:alkylated DNA repair dioxygenase AlkB
VLAREGTVRYEPRALDPAQADALLGALLAQTAWTQEAFTLYGRHVPFPRLSAWYGDPGAVYTYSGIRNEPLPWTAALAALREHLAQRTGVRFNSVLLNQYRHGGEHMGWHADDEPELGPAPVIASLSLGAERVFEFEHRGDRERIAIVLGHGSLLVMEGETQHRWRHRLPKQRDADGVRVNLTFRVVVTAAGPGSL